jgi:hypothetical protein
VSALNAPAALVLRRLEATDTRALLNAVFDSGGDSGGGDGDGGGGD